MSAVRMRHVALALGAAWAFWWAFFATAEAIATRQYGESILLDIVVLGTLAVAWKWPRAGGVLLLIAGASSITLFAPMWIRRFTLDQVLILFAIMPLPPIAAGGLLLLSRRHQSRHHSHLPPVAA